jgi:pimeloyl-ACP methyl ester carboxylesterase
MIPSRSDSATVASRGRRFGAATAALLTLALTAIAPPASHAQQLVRFPASDGGTVQADLYGAGERAVVLVHGGRFDRKSWKAQAEELAAAGYLALAIDLRAVADLRAGKDSPCVYDAPCLAIDVLAAVRYLRANGAKSVFGIGGSLGGGALAQAAAQSPGSIERLVLLAHMPIDEPQKLSGRKLFVTSRDDTSGSGPRLPEIRRQFESAPEPKELLILDGSAHAQFLFETDQGARLMGEILRFLSAP